MKGVKKGLKWIIITFLILIFPELKSQTKQDSIPDRILPKLFIQSYQKDDQTNKLIQLPIKKNVTIDKMPLFCKMEELLFASSKIPVRFRLGTLDYVDKLEGKN